MKPDTYTKVILTAIAGCLAFLAYKVATLPFFAQPKVEAIQPAAIEAAPESKQAAPAEQAKAPAPKVDVAVPAPPPPEPPPMPSAKAALAPEKPEPPQAITPPPKVARLDIVGKQVQEKRLPEAQAAGKSKTEKEVAEKLALEAEAVRKEKEKDDVESARRQKEKEDAEVARKLKEETATAAPGEQEKKQAEAEAARKVKEKEEAATKERERQRKDTADRIARMANAPDSVATVTKDIRERATLSNSYVMRIQAAIRPNITFNPEAISGNPAVDIQVGLAKDGSIKSRVIIRSSGVNGWDTAALNALDKTERLPTDENGAAPTTIVISMRPRDR